MNRETHYLFRNTTLILMALGTILFIGLDSIASAEPTTPLLDPKLVSLVEPRVVAQLPYPEQEMPLDGSVEVYFNTAMNHQSVEQAVKIRPRVALSTEWVDDRTLRLIPQRTLRRAAHYEIIIEPTAQSAEGRPLTEAVELNVNTVGYLGVVEVMPQPDAVDVLSASSITITFNRPIMGSEAQAAGQGTQPITIDPPVDGQGKWIHPAIYRWQPSSALREGQKYRVTVDPHLTDSVGAPLTEPFEWSFTVEPFAASIATTGSTPIPPTTNIQVTFSSPADRAAAEAAFRMAKARGGRRVSGTFRWAEDSRLMIFTPNNPLERDTEYRVVLSRDTRSTAGGELGAAQSLRFTTMPELAVTSTEPSDGGTMEYLSSYSGVRITFSTPLDPGVVHQEGIFRITPEPPGTLQPSYYAYDEGSVVWFYGQLAPNTRYTVSVSGDLADAYGHTLGQPYTFSFRTRPLSPRVQVNIGERVGVYDASRPAQIALLSVAVETVDFELYALPMEVIPDLLNQPYRSSFEQPDTAPIRTWTIVPEGPSDEVRVQTVSLLENGGSLAPGLYLLTYKTANSAYAGPGYQYLFVTNASLTVKNSRDEALVWLTDLQTGQPISNVPVQMYAPSAQTSGGSSDAGLEVIGEGMTGADGVTQFALREQPRVDRWSYYYRSGYTIANSNGIFAIAVPRWSSGIRPYDFGFAGAYQPPQQLLYLYTDRPIYRPGQEVYFKGILRDKDDMLFSLPTVGQVRVSVEELYGGESLGSYTAEVNEMGTFQGSFTIPENAKLGQYSFFAYDDQGNLLSTDPRYEAGDWIPALTIDVAEYRKPEFQVEVSSPHPNWQDEELVEMTIAADYYFGGPVTDAQVEWSVWSLDSDFDPYDGPGRYRFDDITPYSYSYRNYGYYSYWDDYEYDYHYDTPLATGTGTTSEDGTLTVQFPADIAEEINSRRLVFETTVSEREGQDVTGRAEVTVHNTRYYVGIYSDTRYTYVGNNITTHLIVVDWEGNPIPNQVVTVQPVRHVQTRSTDYSSEGDPVYTWTVEQTPMGDPVTVITDASGLASVPVAPPAAGSFRLRAQVTDPAGNTASAGYRTWVTGSQFGFWRGSQADDQIDVILDAERYDPGQTARLLITSPYEGEVQALVTMERAGILQHEVFTFTGPNYEYALPITPEMAPNVYVSVVLIKGVDDTNPVPDFKMGMTELKVNLSTQMLNIQITPTADVVVPDQEVTFQVAVTQLDGTPADAEVSLALVDLAALALKEPNSGPLLEHFYEDQPLGVLTSTSLNALVDRLLLELLPEPEGAGGGGGGGPSAYIDTMLRNEFEDTAYWEAQVRTGEDGIAEVTVEMPDNLTTWRMDARAVTADTLVGQTTLDITARIPLMIRPHTPRFFAAGDQVTLSATVHNNTDHDIEAAALLQATGLNVNGLPLQVVLVPANNHVEIYWPVSVQPAVEWVDTIFAVEGGGYRDAAKPEIGDPEHDHMLPVYHFEMTQDFHAAGQLSAAGMVTEALVLPPGFEVAQGTVRIQLDHSIAGSALEGLTWLEHYEYECNEQLTSKFLPNVLTLQMVSRFGTDDPLLRNNLQEQVRVGLDLIYERQNINGGWGWWPGDASNPQTTAYLLHGMLLAREAGVSVQASAIQDAMSYLADIQRSTETLDEQHERNLDVYVLYVLTLAGVSDDEYADDLYHRRHQLDHYGVALLAQTFWLMDPGDSRLGNLRDHLENAAQVTAEGAHWEEDTLDSMNWNTDVRTTAIILNTYARLWPDSELIPGMVRWLLDARSIGRWPTTQETVWSLLALTEWLAVSGELETAYQWRVLLNGAVIATCEETAATAGESDVIEIDAASLLGGGQDRLVIERGEGAGRLYYTTYLVGYLPVEEIDASSRGVTVSRRYLDAQGNPVSEAHVGDTLTVEITVSTARELRYLIIEDYYPAGAEAVNSMLLTEQQFLERPTWERAVEDFQSYGWGWWEFFRVELHDEKAIATADYVSPGTYVFTYQVQLGVAGEFRVLPATVWEFYADDVYGRTEGSIFTVYPAE